MKKTYYPELDETLYTGVLENGLTVITAPSTRILPWTARNSAPPRVLLTIWSIRCSICLGTGMCPGNSRPWVP